MNLDNTVTEILYQKASEFDYTHGEAGKILTSNTTLTFEQFEGLLRYRYYEIFLNTYFDKFDDFYNSVKVIPDIEHIRNSLNIIVG